MSNTSSISMPIKGMNTDLHQLNTDSSVYGFALNAVIENFWEGNTNFLSNEPSNICNVKFPDGYQVVGKVAIHEQNRIVYILTNPKTGHTQFGEVRNIKYKNRTDIIDTTSCESCQNTGHEITPLEQQKEQCYNQYNIIAPFYNTNGVDCSGININYPIDIEYKITNCSLNLYFTDVLNERRFIYFDYTNNDLTQPLILQDRFKKLNPEEPYTGTEECPIPNYINEIDCDKIKVHPNFDHPCIDFIDFINGGNLKVGTYQILIGYSDQYSNPITNYFASSNVIPLFEKQTTFETNYETFKALKFKINNLKTGGIFQYYNIVIAQTIDQFTEFILLGTFSTTNTEYTYTGFEKTLTKLTPSEVFFRRPYYKSARGVTTANNYLFYTGVKEYPLLNLQPVANKIKLQWTTVALTESAYNDPKNTFYFKSAQRDEVYPYGIIFEFDNARETCAFHIPGREATDNDLEIIEQSNDIMTNLSCNDIISCLDGLTITAYYRRNLNTIINGYSHPCVNQSTHNCNRAVFTVFANNESLGLVNLNNGGNATGFGVSCGYPDLIPGDYGGDRTSVLSLTQNQIETIATASSDGSITIKLECAQLVPCSGCHEDTQWVQITNSANQVLYNGCMVAGTEYTFYPCNTEKKKWEIYNTGSVLGGDYEYSQTCLDKKCWEYGDFAYWESTEKYPQIPEVWGELCGKNIRHHKYPDSLITHIHDGKNLVKTFNDNNYIFPIGVKIDHQSVIDALDQAVLDGVITLEDRSHIVGYRIVRGNRVGNKSIQAKGLLFNMMHYEKFGETYYFPNYAYNDQRINSNGHQDTFLKNVYFDKDENGSQRFTFHSPDTHFVNTGLGNILKIETEERGVTDSYFTHSDCQPKYRFLNTAAHVLALGLGIAAAMSATGEKQCKTVTYTNDVTINGEDGYGNVSGNWTAILTPVGGTHTGTISTTGATVNTTDTEHHNTNPIDLYDPFTGATVPSPKDGAQEQITTCKGQAFQIFNSDSYIGGIITGIIGGAVDVIQRTILGIFEMDKILDTLRSLIPYKNYSIQHNSVGKYNTYIDIENNGNKQRRIAVGAYLNPIIQSIDEPLPSSTPGTNFNTIKVNNWNRESSVYLKTAKSIANPTFGYDQSKVSIDTLGQGIDYLNTHFNTPIASFYASVKRQVLNQYGQLCNIEYLETNSCSFKLNQNYTNCETSIFGGDTFISRFALKRKMPFFLHNMCKLPNDSDVLYKDLGNAGEPLYFFNTRQPLLEKITSLGAFAGIFSALTADNLKNYDAQTNRLFHQDGYIHLFNYGIPYFLVESDINTNYRHGQNHTDKDFYPHNTDLKRWLEEEYVPISTDNYYFYNRTYSKQNKESVICTSCILDKKDLTCQTENYNRLIYSESADTENKNDNWNIFKANSYYDFPLTLGKLITADGIEHDKVLVRLEKGTQIFNAYDTIQTTSENIQVGTGGMFKTRPQDIAITDLGYAGTQHRDIIHTEYGHIWADAERGQVFNLGTGGSGMDEISKDGMKSWFKENLPFQLKEDFPQIPNSFIDNNLNGIGLHYCFDKRFNRILITKLDYKVINKNVRFQNDETNENFGKFYIIENEETKFIELSNTKYFCNKSWTISYNFYNKTWTSFHSYLPVFYVPSLDTFDSGHFSLTTKLVGDKRVLTKLQKSYTHNATNKSYQVFYGKLYPFIIDFQSKQSLNQNFVNSVQFNLDVIRYHNEFDTYYNQLITFNKAIVYNNTQTSGLLNLKVSNPEDLTEIEYPKRINNGYEILVTNSENSWAFNDFFDVTRNQFTNVPIFNYDCNNVNKQLNEKALNYDKDDFDRAGIRSNMCKVRLINDKYSNYKFIFNFSQINQRQSFR